MRFFQDGIDWSVDQVLAVAVESGAVLRRLGVRLPPENRLLKSERAIREHLAVGTLTDFASLRRFTAAQQNAIESFVIGRTTELRRRPGAPKRLRTLLRGNVDLLEDGGSQVRDLQFELLVLALLDLAGVGPAEFAEPDIVVRTPQGSFGIAAKRIGSVEALTERVTEGIDQILGTTGAGLLAVSLDQLLVGVAEDKASQVTEAMSVAAYDIVERRGVIGPIEGVLTVGSKLIHEPHQTPRIHYDLSLRLAGRSGAHTSALREQYETLGERASRSLAALMAAVPDLPAGA